MKFFNCTILRKGEYNNKNIAITFDDGPHPKYTPMIMDILNERGGRGTFFVTGKNISENRSLVKEVSDRGHVIGNHTYSHRNALFTRKKILYDEILRTKEIIEDITGKFNGYFRPPHGNITPVLLSICRKLELTIVLWNANTKDFRRDSYESMVNRVYKKIKAGSIIIFHECHFRDDSRDYSNTIEALKTVSDIAVSKDLKVVTVEDMFNHIINQ